MKPIRRFSVGALVPCAAVFTILTLTAQAQVQWSLAGTGSYLTGSNWTGGNVPGPTQDATINVSGAVVQIGGTDVVANDTFSVTNGRLEMSGGTLTSTDRITVTATAGNVAISGGTANVRAFQVTGGTGTISGGTVNAPVDVRTVSNGSITVSGGTLVAGKMVASGNISASGNAVVTMEQGTGFSAGNTNELWIGTATGTAVTVSGNAIWTHRSTGNSASNVLVGRAGTGTLRIQDNASFTSMAYSGPLGEFTAKVIQVGPNANGVAGNGTVQVDGGTLTSIGYSRGDAGVINANGGTFRAMGASTNYFANFTGTGGTNSVNLQAGGMKFDTNNSDVTISNVLSGPGGLTKLGSGVLTLSGGNTYTGETKVSSGELLMQTPVLDNAGSLVIEDGGVLNLAHGSRDVIGSLTIGTTVHSSGSWGSSASGAANKDDVHFKGPGMVYAGTPPPPRDLVWTGAASSDWSANGDINFTASGTPTFFETSDNVTFSLTSPAVATINLTRIIDAGTLTFGGTSGYTLLAPATGISGSASIIMDSPGVLTLGGAASTFTGPVQVNAGTIVMGDTRSFGNTSGITIADGGQVDVNGKEPGAIYSFTLGGAGPANAGQIINSGPGRFGTVGVKNLTLTADARIGGGERFDIAQGGVITGNGHTLTKVGPADMAFRGSAAGSPIRYVIASGRAWAENTNDALGGAGGGVTVLGGASIGSYGARTLATPLTLQHGSTLNNLGAGKGIWNGGITLNGQITIDAVTGGAIDVTGPINGLGSIVKTGPSDVAFPYTPGGNTTVLQGILRMSGYPSPTGDVVIAEGAALELTNTEVTGEVKSLTLGGIAAPAGTEWGSATSGAPNVSGRLQGPGRVFVTGEPPAEPGYFQWAVGKGLTGYAALPQSDGDGDGIANAIEFVLASNPAAAFDHLPATSVTATHLEFVFRRRASLDGYVPAVQYGTDLTNWATATHGQPALNPVSIEVQPNGADAGVDLIIVRIPKALAPDARLFARLRVTVP